MLTPNIHAIQAIRCLFPSWHEEMIKTIQSLAAGSMLAVPNEFSFSNENLTELEVAIGTSKMFAKYRSALLNLA